MNTVDDRSQPHASLTRAAMRGPWAGLPTAWKEDLSFHEEAFRTDVDRMCKAGAPGIYTAGTTGEFYAMEFDEWEAVTRAAVDVCKANGTPVMVGVTATSTLGAVRRAEVAAALGADAIQAALPYWMAMPASEIVPFFETVAAAAPEQALSIYETSRAKVTLTVDQHRAVSDRTGRYVMVKANAGTVGRTPEGCRALSEFVNVFVGENAWSELGPHGAIGACSALVYMNPRVVLEMFRNLTQQNWQALAVWTDKITRLVSEGLRPVIERGCTDTSLDRLMGVTTGFLTMPLRSRGTYPDTTEDDATRLHAWMRKHTPEFLEL